MPRKKKGELPVRMQVEVPESAYGAVIHLEKVTGLDRKTVVGNTLGWLATQSETMQKTIIGILPDAWRPEFAKAVLEAMVREQAEVPDGSDEQSDKPGRTAVRRTSARRTRSDKQKRAGGAG